ncbi:hypothetical protein G6F68_017788 [Rhizopus microsporus]|nr:hypothetical protein G6F68_017788 [Rhizopus microsporus]
MCSGRLPSRWRPRSRKSAARNRHRVQAAKAEVRRIREVHHDEVVDLGVGFQPAAGVVIDDGDARVLQRPLVQLDQWFRAREQPGFRAPPGHRRRPAPAHYAPRAASAGPDAPPIRDSGVRRATRTAGCC